MYYYEKDYIMRLIHGVAQVLAKLLLGKEMEQQGELIVLRDQRAKDEHDILRRMIDEGQVNQAEEKLSGRKFVRISNSEIINLNKTANFDLSFVGTIQVKLKNGDTTFVSRRYVSEIKKILGI